MRFTGLVAEHQAVMANAGGKRRARQHRMAADGDGEFGAQRQFAARRIQQRESPAANFLARTIEGLGAQIRKIEIELLAWYRTNQVCRRLSTIPGIGFITATALAATVVDAKVFRSGRQFAAWLGLVPKQHSSGGKDRMGGISKMGDRYLRHLLVVGATAVIRYTRRKATTVSTWANQLLERKPARLVTVAVANKVARIAWAVMAREENYRATPSMARG